MTDARPPRSSGDGGIAAFPSRRGLGNHIVRTHEAIFRDCSIASHFSVSFGTAAGRLRMFLSGRKFVDIAFLLSSRFAIAIDLLILGWHSRCGVMPSVRRPYAADDRLCSLYSPMPFQGPHQILTSALVRIPPREP